MDGWTDNVKPVYPPFNFVKARGILTKWVEKVRKMSTFLQFCRPGFRRPICAGKAVLLWSPHVPPLFPLVAPEQPSLTLLDNSLTLQHRETHGCKVNTMVTDALVLKHQAISIYNADLTFIVLDHFHIKISHLWWTTLRNLITFLKKWPSHLGVKKVTWMMGWA